MKRRRYIQIALALVVLFIIGASMLVNSPRVQQRVSVLIATELENHIGTRVSLGGVRWLFPTDIIIDDLAIDDQEGEPLISVSRLAAKVEWMPLILHRQLSIRNIRLFSPDINLYKASAEDDYNYQFLIDAFVKDKKEKAPLDLSLRINTLAVRDARFNHHIGTRHETPITEGDRSLSDVLNSLSISDLSAQLALKMLSADSASLIVRHVEFKEQSGLQLNDLYFRFVGNRQGATLANFQIDFPHSSLRLDTIWASYSAEMSNPIVKGGILPSSHITPCDFAWLIPQVVGLSEKIYLGADFIGSPQRINVKSLNLHTAQHDLSIHADGSWTPAPQNSSHLHSLGTIKGSATATMTPKAWELLARQAPDIYSQIPEEIVRIGNMTVVGDLNHDSKQTNLDLQATTDAGKLVAHLDLNEQGHYTATLRGNDIHVAQVIPVSPLTHTNLAMQARGDISWSTNSTTQQFSSNECSKSRIQLALLNSHADLALTHAQLYGYEHERIEVSGDYAPKSYSGTLHFDESHGRLNLEAAYDTKGNTPHYSVTLRADSLDLHAMHLIPLHEGHTFSTRLNADLRGRDIDHIVGKVLVDSLTMHRPTGDYRIKEVALYASDPRNKMLSLKSDFMDATFRGELTYRSLANSLLGHLHHSLPSLCSDHDHIEPEQANLCLANIEVYDTAPLRELLLLPISNTGNAQFNILVNDAAGELKATATVPQIEYDGNLFKGVSLDLHSMSQGLNLQAGATLDNADTPTLTANLITKATDDVADLALLWSSNPAGVFEGTFNTRAILALDEDDHLDITFETDSTSVTLNHSEWKLDPFSMNIAPRHIAIDGLHFASDSTQHLSANGVIAYHDTDTLKVNFTGLDLSYLFSIVDLKGISFDGTVSGHANMANLYSPQPYIDATVKAQDLTFCKGPLGDLDGHVYWNQENEQLQFNADIWEDPQHVSIIDGIVDLRQSELWIDVSADSTNVAFLNGMLGSFMSDITGHAYGHLTVGGPMKAINLDGMLLADAAFDIIPTDARYHFRDTVRFMPDVIFFNGIEAFDEREQKAIINGTVKHDALKNFAADLYVDAQNLLGIDLPDTGHDSFYTTIYGTGGIHITASPTDPLVIDIQAQTEKGSVFALNLAPQNESSSESFITFTNHTDTRNTPTVTNRNSGTRRRRASETISPTAINISAQVTPDAMLKLVMNQALDDHISISGTGDLQINAQGSDIKLFGTYTANRGFYKLNLQDVINKNFDVLPGSTVSFDGDYMDARLNITARHVVNYVPLKDLNPELPGNAHVNCLLHIGGTLNAPTLTFDLELPKSTEEERAMLRSYTSTEEQMSLQFIYLLGLGKFYTPDLAAQDNQGTGNVESFISSTISGQINNLLSNIISNENWNFASNLRAENMMTGDSDLGGENWENMEIEGILEGHMLDNRLLINGSFGYRENPMYATNFIGDFDIRYLLTGGISLKGYNKTNDRYFSRTSLTTQGIGLVFQRDFEHLLPRRKGSTKAKDKQE